MQCGEKPAKCGKPWSEEDLEYLSDHYGLTSDENMARYLKRSVTSIPVIAHKKFHLKLTDNFYTASELARTLGFLSSNTIVGWARNGWLKGEGSFRGNGRWFWCFSEEDIVECLRQHPGLVDLKKMEDRTLFRTIVQEEWKKDPWYTTTQAASLLGVGNRNVIRYIKRGWLLVILKPCGNLSYIIRRSSIEAFLANDPRPLYWHNARSKSNMIGRDKRGFPSRIETVWHFICPGCGQEVRIVAPPSMMGAEIREKFIFLYVNGACFHSATVKIELP